MFLFAFGNVLALEQALAACAGVRMCVCDDFKGVQQAQLAAQSPHLEFNV